MLASQYNDLRSDAYGGSFLFSHQQTSPDLTLKVEPGVCYVGATRVIYAGGNSPSFTAPSANPRIDLLTIDSSGTLARVAGTESASPTAPAYPSDKLVICEVYNRVSQTQVFDTDQGAGKGYIYNDVRPFLGGAFIASDSQVASGAAISISKISFNGNFIPTADNADDIGSSSSLVKNIYANHFFKGSTEIGSKFGGTGADGALSITSGTTTIDVGAASFFLKNYTSISITGSGKLAFSNPATNGTIILLKSQGNVTLTSSTAPMIDASAMGAAGVTSGFNNIILTLPAAGINGNNSSGTTAGNGANASAANAYPFDQTFIGKVIQVSAGAGGGNGGSSGGGASGTGGRGGGGLIIECAGLWNFTTSNGISVAGQAGTNGTTPGGGAGGSGGGGGAGGTFVGLYNSLTANSGTVNKSGGNGGNGGNGVGNNGGAGGGGGSGGGNRYAGGAGGAGLGTNQSGSASGGSSGGGSSGGSGGSGGSGAGFFGTGPGGSGGGGGGGGGSSGESVVTQNNDWS